MDWACPSTPQQLDSADFTSKQQQGLESEEEKKAFAAGRK